MVDEVVVFNETNLSKVIRLVKPDLLVREQIILKK